MSQSIEARLEALPGKVQRDFKRCGRASCHCAQGAPHGPYFSRVWYESSQRRKAYVKPADVERVKAATELYEIEQHVAGMKKDFHASKLQKRRRWLGELIEQFEAKAQALRQRFSMQEP